MTTIMCWRRKKIKVMKKRFIIQNGYQIKERNILSSKIRNFAIHLNFDQ